jgi:exonuclease SbcD
VRVLHTSDWHLGRTTRGVDRRPDQAAAFEEVLALARDFRPHLVLHSGDLFDFGRPTVEDMKMAHDMLRRLGEVAPVLVLAGNHDSPTLFDLFNELLGPASPVHFVGNPRSPSAGGLLERPGADGETALVAMVPFVHANRAVDMLGVEAAGRHAAYADKMQAIFTAFAQEMERRYDARRHVLLVAAHLYLEGATFSRERSERLLHVSEHYAARAGHLPPVSYAAFGHIHLPQVLPGGLPGWYAGSLIPLDFGEEGEVKQVVLVEAAPGRAPRVRPVPLSAGRPLLTLEGSQEELEGRAAGVGEALLNLVVHTGQPTPGLREWAEKVFPRAVLVEIRERCSASQLTLVEETPGEGGDFATLEEAFEAYLAEAAPEDLDAEASRQLFRGLALEAQAGEALAPAIHGQLAEALAQEVPS